MEQLEHPCEQDVRPFRLSLTIFTIISATTAMTTAAAIKVP
jgi:hypothetical protein